MEHEPHQSPCDAWACTSGATLLALAVAVACGIAIVVFLRRTGARTRADAPVTTITALITVIAARARAYESEATAHFVWVEASRQSVSPEVRAGLNAEFGEVLSLPLLDLSDLYSGDVTLTSAVRDAVAGWLGADGLLHDPDAPLSASLAEPLKARAKLAAARIVSERAAAGM